MKLVDLRERDFDTCWLCGEFVPVIEATSDHLLPKSHGGYNAGDNQKLAHGGCNSARGNLPYDLTVAALAKVAPPETYATDLRFFTRRAAVHRVLRNAHSAWTQNLKVSAALEAVLPKPGDGRPRPARHQAWCDFRWHRGFPPHDIAPICTC